ncbi:MAG: TldD/PmbA family protein [Dehalococcoidales bacterium]
MTDTETTARELADALRKCQADFVEAHIEESRTSHLTYRGKELESIGRSSGRGGNIRALVKGGWGFSSFNDLSDLPRRLEQAVSQARLAAHESSYLTPVEPVVDRVLLEIDQPAIELPLSDKKRLLDEYNEIIWQTPKIRTSVIGYGDGRKKTIYINSAGSFIQQERADVTLRVSAIAAENGEVQQAGISLGSNGDFQAVTGQQEPVAELARRAVSLLSAPQLSSGVYTVVLDPVLAGVFVHEAFGHLSESDFLYENERMRDIMVIGKQFGLPMLNIVDGAAVPGLRGSYKYDDEGVRATRTDLIREGRLVGRLHSRETAAKMKEKPTGNARALNYRYPPIVRMTNTYIEPGEASFDDIIADIKEGVYARNWYGGTTSMEMFTFSAGEAYMIRNGKVAELLRPVNLTGNVFSTLNKINAVANDLEMNQGGGCGKAGQSPLPVANGSPHIRIQGCLVGGK